jgi:Tol biopolymer transport system component
MYFTSDHGGVNHIWRQRFPDGQPEQITSGPTEEEGVAMAADGRSFVTAVALQNTSLWVHDAKGERQISLEGNGYNARFTPDGKKLCYMIACDHAPTVQPPPRGPTYRPRVLPSMGTTRQGSQEWSWSISTSSTHFPSGDK